MTKPFDSLKAKIKRYSNASGPEQAFIPKFLNLLEHPDAFQRTHLPGHITGSAFIVSPGGRSTLLVHHVKLNRWLQPGGHCDGSPDTVSVALREAQEETGIENLILATDELFDLDIHPIPDRKDFPAHDHYDVRYLVLGSPEEKVVVSEESHDVKWVDVNELEKFSREPSLLRMRDKAIQYFRMQDLKK